MCPICGNNKSLVLDTRGNIRRRRCSLCGTEWRTKEELITETIKPSKNANMWKNLK